MNSDDLDDFLDGRGAEIEARFRRLELDAEIARMRQHPGGKAPDDVPPPSSGGQEDPLADLKAALEQEQDRPRYLLVLCPHCEGKNRMSLTRARTMNPVCGRCKEHLSFEKDPVK